MVLVDENADGFVGYLGVCILRNAFTSILFWEVEDSTLPMANFYNRKIVFWEWEVFLCLEGRFRIEDNVV